MKQGETFVNLGGNGGRNDNPYARMAGPDFKRGNETFVPGMSDHTPAGQPVNTAQAKPNTPVVGFLYSISRQGIGEYWPLHLGTNTIGRAADCDIQLKEMSVSEHHATLSIKQMKTTHKLIASIRDTGSKNGMYLNDEELDYDNHSCKANDIITVGTCYKLLLLLIDAEQYGLSVAEDFVPVEEAEDDFAPYTGGTPQGTGIPSDSTHSNFNPYNADNRNVDTGTVDLNGEEYTRPGGTKFM